MKRWIRWLGAAGALSMALLHGAALAEDMPIVTDVPLTPQEQAEAAASADPEDRMRQAQQMLIDLNLLDGAADGAYGPKTALALRTFQERYNLEKTGALDDATYAALAEKASQANAARQVQQRLIDLGYMRGKADGIFGERSQAALKLFQSLQGLEPTGEADAATLAALNDPNQAVLPARLSKGDKGDAVKALQERLIQLGFLTDAADGSYGPATSAAVKRFQNHLLAQGVDEGMGISATGEATPATQLLLFDANYSSYLSDVALGAEGSEAQRVERRLSQLGYMDAQPDEVFDAYAAQCAAAFRADAQLGLGGAVDKTTLDALFSDAAPRAEHYVRHDIAYKDRGQAVREVEQTLLLGGVMIKLPDGRYDDSVQSAVGQLYELLTARGDARAALFADPALLTVSAQEALADGLLDEQAQLNSDSAAEVKRVQRRLHTLYYLDKFSIDGKLGDGVGAALREFQSANGLSETGVADADTMKLLFSDAAVSKRLPYRVEVSIDDQRVYVYELNDQNEYEQTHEFICSTGLGNSTPRGIFLDGYPCNNWHYFKEFDCWAKYSFEVEGNIMIHSVIYSEKKESTLRENSLYALGQKASHGCIRLKVADAYWLFKNCKRGSLVIVIY